MKKSDLFKSINKKTNAVAANDSPYAKVTGFIDTGVLAINHVISGDIYKGIPEGRITVLAGESQTGKSWLAANIIANALKPVEEGGNGYDKVYYLDSEGGGLWDFLKAKEVDLDKIEYIPVKSVESCSVSILNIYEQLCTAAEEYHADPANNDLPKCLVILDSFGALSADKLVTDATNKGQQVQDMGLSAKLKNNMMTGLMMRTVISNCPLIVINHVYDDPAAMFTSKIKSMPGGKKLEFAAHVIVQTAKKRIKAGDQTFGYRNRVVENDGYYRGSELRFFTVKNRIVKPNYEAAIFLDYTQGLSKYEGLLEDAQRLGYVENRRGKWYVPSYDDKVHSYDDLLDNDEIWKSFIDKFNDQCQKEVSYSSKFEEQLNELEREIDEVGEVPVVRNEDTEPAMPGEI